MKFIQSVFFDQSVFTSFEIKALDMQISHISYFIEAAYCESPKNFVACYFLSLLLANF